MNLKKLRQILKVLGDDTRLCILNLLNKNELTVTDIGFILKKNQPIISKHLERLRMVRIVNDRRDGNFIYYSLIRDEAVDKIIQFILITFETIEMFQKDNKKLVTLNKSK